MHPSSPFSRLSSSSKQWLSRHSRDPYVKRRVLDQLALRSRSAYKLMEMDDKYHFLSGMRPGIPRPQVIVDLGAAPGGWSQVAAFRTGHSIIPEITSDLLEEKPFGLKGKDKRQEHDTSEEPPEQKLPTIIALDLHRMDHINGVISLQADFLSPTAEILIRESLPPQHRSQSVDVLLSDMAANQTGNSTVDAARSLEISQAVFQFACGHLSLRRRDIPSGGTMVLKYFQHPDSTQFCKKYLRPSFSSVSSFKPPSSRSESSEQYWICFGFLGYRTPPDPIPDTPANRADLRRLI